MSSDVPFDDPLTSGRKPTFKPRKEFIYLTESGKRKRLAALARQESLRRISSLLPNQQSSTSQNPKIFNEASFSYDADMENSDAVSETYDEAFKSMLYYADHSAGDSTAEELSARRKVNKPSRHISTTESDRENDAPTKKWRKVGMKASQVILQGPLPLPKMPQPPHNAFAKKKRPPLQQMRNKTKEMVKSSEAINNVEVVMRASDFFASNDAELGIDAEFEDLLGGEASQCRSISDEDEEFQPLPVEHLLHQSPPQRLPPQQSSVHQPRSQQPPVHLPRLQPQRPSNSFIQPYGDTQHPPTDMNDEEEMFSEEEIRELYQMTPKQLMVKMYGMLAKMSAKMDSLQKDVNYLKECLNSKGRQAANNTQAAPIDLKSIFLDLPCSSVESMEALDTHLRGSSQDTRRKFFQGLRQIGGRHPGDMIRGMLVRLVRNTVARLYSLKGKGDGNEKFEDLLIFSMMLDVVRSHETHKFYEEELFNTTVSNWLRNSNKRLASELKRPAVANVPIADYL